MKSPSCTLCAATLVVQQAKRSMVSIRFIVLFHFKEFVVHRRHGHAQVFALLVHSLHVYIEEFHLRLLVGRGPSPRSPRRGESFVSA